MYIKAVDKKKYNLCALLLELQERVCSMCVYFYRTVQGVPSGLTSLSNQIINKPDTRQAQTKCKIMLFENLKK